MNHFTKKSFTSSLSFRNKRGFTLVELMVSIGVVAIVSAIALPNLNEFLVKMRVDNEINEMQKLLLTARNIAINTGKVTTVCPLSGAGACTTNWQNEISVFTNSANNLANGNTYTGPTSTLDVDGNTIITINDELVKIKEPIRQGDVIQFAPSSIIYMPSGQLLTPNVATLFSYCPSNNTNYSRGIDITISGRSNASSDIDNDGKDEDRSGTDITCN